MTGYFEEVRLDRIAAEFPVGQAFLDGPARMSADALRALQERRFRRVLQRAWQVPFYRRLWGAAGIEPGDIGGLDDIHRLPSFSKTDLMASVERAPPFGDYHGVDWAAGAARPSVVLHTTSGTTGAPQPLFFGAWDREVQNLLLARAYLLAGLRADDVVHSVYGFGLVNGGHYIREAVLHFTKALFLPAGTGLETRSEQQVEIMRRFGVTVVVGFMDYVKRLGELAMERGIVPGRDIPVRMIVGHLGQDSRASVSALWGGAEVFDWYGVGDTGVVAAEGPARNGLHVFEDAHYLEILDPDSGAVLGDGGRGNMCVTVLFKDTVYPIVRFNTNDVTEVLPGDGGSGIGFRRIAGFLGRSDNMVKLRGVNVYPTGIGALLRDLPEAGGEYVCRVARQGHRDEMTVVVEVTGGTEDDGAVAARCRELLRERLGVEVAVELVGPGGTAALTEIERRQKPIRLIDGRPK